jgi:hypothetical protein
MLTPSQSDIASNAPFIGRLPTELLIHIFNACIPEALEARIEDQLLMPSRFLEVCKLWNEVAATQPTLWTVLRNEYEIGFDDEVTMRGIERWAERSKGCSIALSLLFRPGALTWNRSLILPWENVAHLELIDCNFRPDQAFTFLSKCINLITCNLELDGLSFLDDDSSDDEASSGGFYTGDDSASDGDLSSEDGVLSDEGYSSGEEDFSGDEDSEHGGYSADDDQSPHNSEPFINEDRDSTDDNTALELLQLRCLSLRFDSQLFSDDRALDSGTVISPLFERLILPALEELSIVATHSCLDNQLLPILIDLRRVSNFALIYLHIENIRCEADDLYHLLLNLPTLQELGLISSTFCNSFPDVVARLAYVPSKGSRNMLPNLEALSVFDDVLPRDLSSTDAAVLHVLESRWWSDDEPRYGKFGLVRLSEASLRWGSSNTCCYSDLVTARLRASELLKQGMILSYPTLDIE